MTLSGLHNDRYRILHPLGSGAMGEVYLVEDTRLHRQVAIKVVRAEATASPNSRAAREAARLFQREARAIAQLNHPNILPLFDFGEENLNNATFTYMVMPFCAEGSLSNWLQQHGEPASGDCSIFGIPWIGSPLEGYFSNYKDEYSPLVGYFASQNGSYSPLPYDLPTIEQSLKLRCIFSSNLPIVLVYSKECFLGY